MDFDNLCLKDKTPYPQIVDAVASKRTVGILKDLVSSSGYSELSASLLYSFQSFVCNKRAAKISKILEEIAIVEMHHIELLSKAIISFGGIPVFQDSSGQYFSTSYINYSTNLYEMLHINIRAEKGAIEDYTRAAKMVDNESLKNLFQRIKKDEECHLKIFEQLLNEIEFFSVKM